MAEKTDFSAQRLTLDGEEEVAATEVVELQRLSMITCLVLVPRFFQQRDALVHPVERVEWVVVGGVDESWVALLPAEVGVGKVG